MSLFHEARLYWEVCRIAWGGDIHSRAEACGTLRFLAVRGKSKRIREASQSTLRALAKRLGLVDHIAREYGRTQ